jgi:hypothetical protein
MGYFSNPLEIRSDLLGLSLFITGGIVITLLLYHSGFKHSQAFWILIIWNSFLLTSFSLVFFLNILMSLLMFKSIAFPKNVTNKSKWIGAFVCLITGTVYFIFLIPAAITLIPTTTLHIEEIKTTLLSVAFVSLCFLLIPKPRNMLYDSLINLRRDIMVDYIDTNQATEQIKLILYGRRANHFLSNLIAEFLEIWNELNRLLKDLAELSGKVDAGKDNLSEIELKLITKEFNSISEKKQILNKNAIQKIFKIEFAISVLKIMDQESLADIKPLIEEMKKQMELGSTKLPLLSTETKKKKESSNH